ncbi:uncharacterized protein MONOS_730 [Monocercomonoides exilis]|uniref:uncharacterized protein n=1 Tax=Monocercomonoides exilis TaxID=2049356 RepID=UPI00355A8F2E|nr:hypothetical protein MONOS_730 [Monocercomonoides exilis]|eukprot:MONOS_730.1-p1 / transcript=MONOS_730.1 / gene=MONOS_730 / organism=Monocercomonoides_exilis_PA203 / gene_product=unspecified product / transcript_product=unspecified product / location=Mono_scaffold00012:134270-140232(+) / protein_length=1914 / sequence_SO=supercontig / SO=protein_coding / is_pseudo=false
MTTRGNLVTPTDIVGITPPSFAFTLLATHKYRLQRCMSKSTKAAQTAAETITKQIKSIQEGILAYIDMTDSMRWDFLRMCVSFVPQGFCESCCENVLNLEEQSSTFRSGPGRSKYKSKTVPNLEYLPKVYICPGCNVGCYCCREHYKDDIENHWKICGSLNTLSKVTEQEIYNVMHEKEDLDLGYSIVSTVLREHDKDTQKRAQVERELKEWLVQQDQRVDNMKPETFSTGAQLSEKDDKEEKGQITEEKQTDKEKSENESNEDEKDEIVDNNVKERTFQLSGSKLASSIELDPELGEEANSSMSFLSNIVSGYSQQKAEFSSFFNTAMKQYSSSLGRSRMNASNRNGERNRSFLESSQKEMTLSISPVSNSASSEFNLSSFSPSSSSSSSSSVKNREFSNKSAENSNLPSFLKPSLTIPTIKTDSTAAELSQVVPASPSLSTESPQSLPSLSPSSLVDAQSQLAFAPPSPSSSPYGLSSLPMSATASSSSLSSSHNPFFSMEIAKVLMAQHRLVEEMKSEMAELKQIIQLQEESHSQKLGDWNVERTQMNERMFILEERHKKMLEISAENTRLQLQLSLVPQQLDEAAAKGAKAKQEEMAKVVQAREDEIRKERSLRGEVERDKAKVVHEKEECEEALKTMTERCQQISERAEQREKEWVQMREKELKEMRERDENSAFPFAERQKKEEEITILKAKVSSLKEQLQQFKGSSDEHKGSERVLSARSRDERGNRILKPLSRRSSSSSILQRTPSASSISSQLSAANSRASDINTAQPSSSSSSSSSLSSSSPSPSLAQSPFMDPSSSPHPPQTPTEMPQMSSSSINKQNMSQRSLNSSPTMSSSSSSSSSSFVRHPSSRSSDAPFDSFSASDEQSVDTFRAKEICDRLSLKETSISPLSSTRENKMEGAFNENEGEGEGGGENRKGSEMTKERSILKAAEGMSEGSYASNLGGSAGDQSTASLYSSSSAQSKQSQLDATPPSISPLSLSHLSSLQPRSLKAPTSMAALECSAANKSKEISTTYWLTERVRDTEQPVSPHLTKNPSFFPMLSPTRIHTTAVFPSAAVPLSASSTSLCSTFSTLPRSEIETASFKDARNDSFAPLSAAPLPPKLIPGSSRKAQRVITFDMTPSTSDLYSTASSLPSFNPPPSRSPLASSALKVASNVPCSTILLLKMPNGLWFLSSPLPHCAPIEEEEGEGKGEGEEGEIEIEIEEEEVNASVKEENDDEYFNPGEGAGNSLAATPKTIMASDITLTETQTLPVSLSDSLLRSISAESVASAIQTEQQESSPSIQPSPTPNVSVPPDPSSISLLRSSCKSLHSEQQDVRFGNSRSQISFISPSLFNVTFCPISSSDPVLQRYFRVPPSEPGIYEIMVPDSELERLNVPEAAMPSLRSPDISRTSLPSYSSSSTSLSSLLRDRFHPTLTPNPSLVVPKKSSIQFGQAADSKGNAVGEANAREQRVPTRRREGTRLVDTIRRTRRMMHEEEAALRRELSEINGQKGKPSDLPPSSVSAPSLSAVKERKPFDIPSFHMSPSPSRNGESKSRSPSPPKSSIVSVPTVLLKKEKAPEEHRMHHLSPSEHKFQHIIASSEHKQREKARMQAKEKEEENFKQGTFNPTEVDTDASENVRNSPKQQTSPLSSKAAAASSSNPASSSSSSEPLSSPFTLSSPFSTETALNASPSYILSSAMPPSSTQVHPAVPNADTVILNNIEAVESLAASRSPRSSRQSSAHSPLSSSRTFVSPRTLSRPSSAVPPSTKASFLQSQQPLGGSAAHTDRASLSSSRRNSSDASQPSFAASPGLAKRAAPKIQTHSVYLHQQPQHATASKAVSSPGSTSRSQTLCHSPSLPSGNASGSAARPSSPASASVLSPQRQSVSKPQLINPENSAETLLKQSALKPAAPIKPDETTFFPL